MRNAAAAPVSAPVGDPTNINPQLAKLAAPISGLKPDPQNVNTHDERSIATIKASYTEFGQQRPVVALVDGTVIAGNGQLEAATQLGWKKLAVVRFTDEAKARAFAIADNRTAELSVRDPKLLAAALQELREADYQLTTIGYSDDELAKLVVQVEEAAQGDAARDESLYTKKIQAPIYEPKLPAPPPLADLVEQTKAVALIAEIERAKIPAEVKQFLQVAAARHNVFDYESIAEFYAHASKDVQVLMERSALVIIDFDKAIEQGHVLLSEDLANAYAASPEASAEDAA